MRIVIDMQGAQTESRFRGIGRYTMAFAQAVVRNRGNHEIVLALSGLFPETIEPIRAAFDGLLPQKNIRVWDAPGPVREVEVGNGVRREAAELLREAFLASLQPDVIHISSLFEGYVDDAVTSIGLFDAATPATVILYDFIPLLNPDHYLKPNPQYERYYSRKIEFLRKATSLLAISDFSRREGAETLGIQDDRVINVSTAIDGLFKTVSIDEAEAEFSRKKFGITRSYVLYTGGSDERKNLPRLIAAFAALPERLQGRYQLVFAGNMPEGDVASLRQLAKNNKLGAAELLFTGYVSDDELVQLYNLCQLFVFPSWHEGFGLPALEAMACGAPVIGANTSSLPEVIGLQEALFDPVDVAAISEKMAQALEDDGFRERLRKHGLAQAKRFSWDETANRAFKAWEAMSRQNRHAANNYLTRSTAHDQLINTVVQRVDEHDEATLTALADSIAKNQCAGIERQLFIDVSELCQHDAATGVQRVVRSYLKWLLQSPPEGFRVEPVYATLHDGYRYARRFTMRFLGGDSPAATDDWVRWQRGDVFFGLDMQHHVQITHADFYKKLREKGVLVKFMVYDLLPIELADYFSGSGAKALHEDLMRIVAQSDGAICISKATSDALARWLRKTGIATAPDFQNTWVHIGADIQASHPSAGLSDDAPQVLKKISERPTFLCLSTIEPRKAQDQILASMEVLWSKDLDANLVFVGKAGWKVDALIHKLSAHQELGKRLFWLQGISDEYLEKVYDVSNCLVAASINEGFGLSLVEAARHRLSIVARDIPVFREIAADQALYFKGLSAEDLAFAMADWLKKYCSGQSTPANLAWLNWQESSEQLKKALLIGIKRRQLLVDVSELVVRDAKSGIQRVVRNILSEWLQMPTAPYEVVPVYASPGQPYRYCEVVSSAPLVLKQNPSVDKAIDYAPADYFIGLDFQPQVVHSQKHFYQQLRRSGVSVKFIVYDLLSILMPQYFVLGTAEPFKKWLATVCESDGAICISKAVAGELTAWMAENGIQNLRPFKIDWFHLGSDFERSMTVTESEKEVLKLLRQLEQRLTFLMVGTLEPRKGHLQVLDAIESLWAEGVDVNLVIVGKEGWMVDELLSRLTLHSEKDHRLFWLNGISDGFLEKLYESSDCLIAASYGEGFGLPIIEAANRGIPVIARDIPVFREVAGDGASFFNAQDGNMLAGAILAWVDQADLGNAQGLTSAKAVSWKESAAWLLRLVLGAHDSSVVKTTIEDAS